MSIQTIKTVEYNCKRCGNHLTQTSEDGLTCGNSIIRAKTPLDCNKCGFTNVWRPEKVDKSSNFSKNFEKIAFNT